MPQASEKDMRNAAQPQSSFARRKSKFSRIEPDRVVDFLQRAHPLKTADHVSAGTGIPSGTVRKWLEGKSLPKSGALIALIGAYGPALLAVAFGEEPPEWLSKAARAERQAELEARLAQTSAELAQVRSQS
jgi:hypothetical protein